MYLLQVLGCVAQLKAQGIPERVERKPCRPCISCREGHVLFIRVAPVGAWLVGTKASNNQPRSEMASYYCCYCYFSYRTILRHSASFIKVKSVSCPGALLASSCLLGQR